MAPPSESTPLPFPATGRLIGVDYGTVRVGLAVSDPDRIIASALTTHTRQSDAADAAFFARTADAERAVGWVVGLPLYMSGDESPKSREARAFGAWLSDATGRPVAYWDERYTSALADDAFREAKLTHKKRKGTRDRVAAVLILQGFLDAGCPTG